MRRAFLFSSGVVGIVVGVFALAYLTSAAARVTFTGEGTVQEHDFSGKNIRIHFTKMSASAEKFLGRSIDVGVSSAKIYAKDDQGKRKRVRQGNLPIGGRVTVKGTVKSDDRLLATTVTRQEGTFTMEGTLRTYSASRRDITIDVKTSNYKKSRYEGKDSVFFVFSDSTKVYGKTGSAKQLDEVTVNDQKVRVEGKEVGTQLEVSKLTELR